MAVFGTFRAVHLKTCMCVCVCVFMSVCVCAASSFRFPPLLSCFCLLTRDSLVFHSGTNTQCHSSSVFFLFFSLLTWYRVPVYSSSGYIFLVSFHVFGRANHTEKPIKYCAAAGRWNLCSSNRVKPSGNTKTCTYWLFFFSPLDFYFTVKSIQVTLNWFNSLWVS